MQSLKIAIRNLSRYKYRTWLTGGMILITTFIFIFGLSLAEGVFQGLANRIKILNTGDVIITSDKNKESTDASFDDVKWEKQRVENKEQINNTILEYDGVKNVTNRVKVTSIISANKKSGSCVIVGIEPDKEKTLLKSDLAIKDGEFLPTDKADKKIYISSTIARSYKVGVGDTLELVCQTDDKSSSAMKFRVCGIFNDTSWKEYYVYADILDVQELSKLNNDTVTHIRVLLDSGNEVNIAEQINEKIGNLYHIYARDWKSASGLLLATVMVIQSSVIGMCIILFFLIIVIFINNISMSIYERTNEIGILKAMGMEDKSITKLLLMEVFILSSSFALLGELIGIIVIMILSKVGIPASVEVLKMSFGGDYAYPMIKIEYVIITLIIPIIVAIVVSLFPLHKIAKLEPAEAVSKKE